MNTHQNKIFRNKEKKTSRFAFVGSQRQRDEYEFLRKKHGFTLSALFDLGVSQAHASIESRKGLAQKKHALIIYKCETSRKGTYYKLSPGRIKKTSPMYLYSIKLISVNKVELTYFEASWSNKKKSIQVFIERVDLVLLQKFKIKWKE